MDLLIIKINIHVIVSGIQNLFLPYMGVGFFIILF